MWWRFSFYESPFYLTTNVSRLHLKSLKVPIDTTTGQIFRDILWYRIYDILSELHGENMIHINHDLYGILDHGNCLSLKITQRSSLTVPYIAFYVFSRRILLHMFHICRRFNLEWYSYNLSLCIYRYPKASIAVEATSLSYSEWHIFVARQRITNIDKFDYLPSFPQGDDLVRL